MTRFALLSSLLLASAAALPAAAGDVVRIDSHGGDAVHGSGNLRSESRPVTGFDSIVVEDSADLNITAGRDFAVTVTADDNLLPLIDTRLRDHELVIGSHGSYSTHHSVKVVVSLPKLQSLRLSGSGDAEVAGISGGDVAFAIDGSGNIRAAGSAAKLDAVIEGSGDLDLRALPVTGAKVRIDGSGSAKVAASDSLEVEINGSGNVDYAGSPSRLQKTINGSGSVGRL